MLVNKNKEAMTSAVVIFPTVLDTNEAGQCSPNPAPWVIEAHIQTKRMDA